MYRSVFLAASALVLVSCGASDDTDMNDPSALTPPNGQIGVDTPPAKPAVPAESADMEEGRALDADTIDSGEAAEITVTLPSNISELDDGLASRIRELAYEGTDEFVANAENEQEAARNDEFPFRQHSLEVTWQQVGPKTGRLFSYLGTSWFYTGGAHGNFGFDILNWDENRRSEIGFANIFADEAAAIDVLKTELRAGLLKAKKDRLGETDLPDDQLTEWIDPALTDDVADYGNFTFAQSNVSGAVGGLTFYYPPYAVGSYAEGDYRVTIPATRLKSIIAPEYANLFEGDPVDANPPGE